MFYRFYVEIIRSWIQYRSLICLKFGWISRKLAHIQILITLGITGAMRKQYGLDIATASLIFICLCLRHRRIQTTEPWVLILLSWRLWGLYMSKIYNLWCWWISYGRFGVQLLVTKKAWGILCPDPFSSFVVIVPCWSFLNWDLFSAYICRFFNFLVLIYFFLYLL